MTYENNENRQIGFKDAISLGLGVLLPLEFVTMALIVVLSVLVGAGAGPGLSTGLMIGLITAISTIGFQQFVVRTRPSGGRRAVLVFRSLIWIILGAVPIVTMLVAAGLLTNCYGSGCDMLSHVVLVGMLVACVVSLLMMPLGWRLLHRATWLKPRIA